LFYFFKQCMKRRHFRQNTIFHLNENGANWCQNTNQSSICDLFNQVLNFNFDLKINPILSLPKINRWPWSWPPFPTWSLVSDLCNLTLNWAINF
jgi:hypothetical protein